MFNSNYKLLAESLKSAKEKYLDTDKILLQIFDYYVKHDPSKTKKYLEWMCKQDELVYSTDEIIKVVNTFDKAVKTKYELPSKDINSYKSVDSLNEALKGFEAYKLTTRASKKSQGAEKLFENDKCIMLYIKTKEACMLYGSNTKWCITEKDKNFWEEYNGENFFVYLIHKKLSSVKYAITINLETFLNYNTDPYIIQVSVWNPLDKNVTPVFDDILQEMGINGQKAFFDIIKEAIPSSTIYKTKRKETLAFLINQGHITKNADGTYNIHDIHQNFNKSYRALLKNSKLTVKFKHCKGILRFNFLDLTSLEGCPEEVYGSFYCNSNYLTSLKGGPKIVTNNYFCQDNPDLTSLKGCPKEIWGNFKAYSCNLINLQGSPKIIGNKFNDSCFAVSDNPHLTSLVGGPKEVYGDYYCRHCNLKNLKGIAKIISGDLLIAGNSLKSLEGLEECKITGFIVLNISSYNTFANNGTLQKYKELGYTFRR